MSLQTWIDEFYPVAAETLPKDDKVLLEHALKKWRGLTPENLTKHDLVNMSGTLREQGRTLYGFKITSDTCSLCYWYCFSDVVGGREDGCHSCPLFKTRRNTCDSGYGADSPYGAFTYSDNPKPMIELIEQALKDLEAPPKEEVE